MIQTIAPPSAQGCLFYTAPVINCDSPASARCAYGNAAQEIVYALLDIERIPINVQYSTNFDGKKGAMYFEIKSTKQQGGKVVVYDWRVQKEILANVPLTYLLVCHKLNQHREDIVQVMADTGVVIYSLPAAVVHHLAHELPKRTLKMSEANARSGYMRGEYKTGYRNIDLRTIIDSCQWSNSEILNTIGTGTVTLRTYKGGTDG